MGIQLNLAAALREPGDSHRYRVCGLQLCTDYPLPCLAPFGSPGGASDDAPARVHDAALSASGMDRRETTGMVGGRERRVSLEAVPEGAFIDIEGFGRYSLSADGSIITLLELVPPPEIELVEECTLGAPLIVGLALRECWFLHAATVVVDGRAVVFAGPSGSGKSTLAARLDHEPGCRRIADDLLGLRLSDGIVGAWPAYPQLKLPHASQPRLPTAAVGAIYILRPAAPSERFRIRRIEKSEKLIALVRHSVSARLFPAGVLSRHLEFCRAAALVEMTEIVYPRTERALEEIVSLVANPGPAECR
ncbi:MAG: hypothetical protein U5R46_11390 [Gammaproteobacteria bacterium]|nr:hypothetical protein [Gammaproteobacteria bacterium]